jgi:hypothetical protein
MNLDRYALLFATLAVGSMPLKAQIAFGGQPVGIKAEKLGWSKPAVAEFPAVDEAALLAEDEARATDGVKGPFRFGFNHSADLSLQNSGTWTVMPNGTRVWRLELKSPGARSINFVFDEYVVPEGAQVFVYNADHAWLGAFTQASSGGRTEMGVTQLAGDAVTVEYIEPATLQGQGRLHINQVTHAYRDVLGLMKGLGDSGSCNNNVICPEGDDWRDEIASVAMITVGGSGICTGTLINNCANDGTPYFLTANHCTSGSNVGTWGFRFNWDSPTCTPTTNGPTNQTVSGSSLLASSAGSDVALLQLNTTPPASYGVYYAGWDATGTAATSTTCIHHPSGDIKKISFDNNASTPGNFGGAACWRIATWEDGTTEPGSSGSGLWNQDHRLVGQLFGGEANCGNNVNDYFGRFNVSYPLLDEWLGTCATVLNGYDPNGSPLGLDAAIQSISGIEESYCGSNVIGPSLVFKNNGTTAITSLLYSYNVDGGTATNATWNGNLAPGATATLALGNITVSNGAHTFNASCSSPNGGTDENLGNNTRSQSFVVADPGYTITLNITQDAYGSETTWEVATEGGAVLFTGGPYADGDDGVVVSTDICLGEGCYVLTMLDDYGDGICCQYGNGDFEVLGPFGAQLVNGNGTFTDASINPFCVSANSVQEGSIAAGLRVFPNPGDGRFTVTLPKGNAPTFLTVRDAVGREVMTMNSSAGGNTSLDLRSLAIGNYSLEVRMGQERAVRQLSIVR